MLHIASRTQPTVLMCALAAVADPLMARLRSNGTSKLADVAYLGQVYDEVGGAGWSDTLLACLADPAPEDRSLVAPFLEQYKWPRQVYFEDGLSRLLGISSIPTTLVLGKSGQVFSRLNGFVPDRFVDMLVERVKEALAE